MQAFSLLLAVLASVISLTSAVAFAPTSVPFNHSHPTGRPSHSFTASWNSESISKFAESMTQWEEWTTKHAGHNHTMTGMPSMTETGQPDATSTIHKTKTIPPTAMLVRDDGDHKSHTETAEPHPTAPVLTGPKTFTGTYSQDASGGLHRTLPHGAPTGPKPITGNPSWTGPTITGLHGKATGRPTSAPTYSWTTSFTKKISASVISDFAATASMSPRDVDDDDWHGCTLALFRGGGRCIPNTKTTKLEDREVKTEKTRTHTNHHTLPHAYAPSATGEHTAHRSQHSSIWPAVTPAISQ